MSDTSAIRDALGGYVEKKNQGDNASLRSALNDLKYTVRQSVYNTPYPNTPAPSAPKPTTPPTQPTTTPTQTAGAVQPPASVSGAPQVTYAPNVTPPQAEPQDFFQSLESKTDAGIDTVAGLLGTDTSNPFARVGGFLLGAGQQVLGAAGDIAGTVGQGINAADEAAIRAQQAIRGEGYDAPLPSNYIKPTDAFANLAGAYNEGLQQPIVGIGGKVMGALGETLFPAYKNKDADTARLTAPTPDVQQTINATFDAIGRGDLVGALGNVLASLRQYGNQQYEEIEKVDPLGALAASLVLDPLNFVPGMGVGKAQQAGKLAEITRDVGRIENVAELLPKGVMGRIMTPAAKVTETVKSALQNIGLRTQYADNAEELFGNYRRFMKAGEDAKGFAKVVEEMAGMASVPAQRAQRLVQGMGKEVDTIEQAYRTMETVLRGADELADVSKLPKTFQNFIKDVRAGTASADDALDVLKAEMATRTSKYFAEQGAKLFPVKGMAAPVKVAERFMNELRGFESLVYIGLSPFTFVRNVINGVSTMAIEGLNPLWDASREIGRLTKMGQVGKAKELQRAIEFQETLMKTGRNVREAMGLGTYGTGATGYFGNFMSNMIHGTPIGKPLQWYQRMENSMRARVWSQTYYRALQHNWDVGKFIPEMDAVTQAVLHQYRVDPQKIMGIVREAGVHDKAAVGREVLNYLRGQRGEALDLERLAEEMGLSKQQLMSFLDEHDVAKAQSMAQEISAQVANGKHPAQAVNDVVGQAARDTAEEVIARTGAQAPDQVGMTLQELEARRGELVAQWAAASKTRGGRKIADDLAAEIDAVERELERLGYGNAPEAAQVAQAAPNVAPEAAQAAEQVAQEAGTIVLPDALRGTMYADEWAQMTDAQREFVIGLERAKQTPMQTAPMEVLPQVADTYQAVGDVPTLMPDVTTGVPAPKEAPPTLGDVAKAAQGKGIATATAEGKPLNKHLLNVLNKHAEENGVAKFANMADVQARPDDALRILDAYAPADAPASVQKAVDDLKDEIFGNEFDWRGKQEITNRRPIDLGEGYRWSNQTPPTQPAPPTPKPTEPTPPVSDATPPAVPEVPNAPKEAWQMTYDDWRQSLERQLKIEYPEAAPQDIVDTLKSRDSEWKSSIEQSIQHGERVPNDVLDSYISKYGEQPFLRLSRGVSEQKGYVLPSLRGEADKFIPREPLVKERWQKTWKEVAADNKGGAGDRRLTPQDYAKLKAKHKADVESALYNNKPVPADVLADYPDLAAKYGNAQAAGIQDVTPPAPPKEMSVSEHFAAATREFPSYPKSDVQITGANDGFVTFADGSKRRRIGQGTQKDVYPLDDGRVVKVARNTEYGDGYIEVEAYNYFNAPPEVQKNLARVEGVGTYTDAAGKEHKFLVVENVTNIDAMQPTKAQMDAVESYFGRGDYGFNANGKAKQWGKTADGRVVLADYQNFKAMAEDTRRAAERAKQLEGNANPLVAYLAKKGIGQSLYNDILSGTIDEKRFMEWIDSMRDSSLLSKEQHAELTRLFEKRNLAPPTQPIPPPTPEVPSAPSVANDSALAQYEQAQRELKNAINAKYNSPRERADAIDAAREKVNQARVNAESPQYAQYAIGEKVWFKGDEYTIIGDQKQISGGWFQDAERADGKKITVPTKGTLENQVSKSRASSQQMQEGFRRLKQSETPDAARLADDIPAGVTNAAEANGVFEGTLFDVVNNPQQMTREQFDAWYQTRPIPEKVRLETAAYREKNGALTKAQVRSAGKAGGAGVRVSNQDLYEYYLNTRKASGRIADQIPAGKPVPAEVLADYPDLAAKYAPAQAGGGAKELSDIEKKVQAEYAKGKFGKSGGFTPTQEQYIVEQLKAGAREIKVPADGTVRVNNEYQAEQLEKVITGQKRITPNDMSTHDTNINNEAMRYAKFFGSPKAAREAIRARAKALELHIADNAGTGEEIFWHKLDKRLAEFEKKMPKSLEKALAEKAAKGNIRNVSDQSIRGVDPNEMHNAQRGYSQRFNAQAEIDNLRQVATEDPQAVSILSRDEMLKAKARTQADMYEALMRVYNSEPAARVRVGTDAENRVMAWLRRDVFNGMDESRAAAQVTADWMDNAVMISRDGETHFDSALNWLSPFQFWGTRYALQSARRVADKPARLMWYLKLRDMQDQVENDPRFPKRLRGMMTLPFPGAPKWAGSMWFDPLETFTQIESVFKMNQFDNALTDSDVAGAIRALVESGRVSPSEAANAIANKSGALWDATKAQMEEATKQQEGLDSITTAFKPHMPFDIIWKLRTGNAADIGVLFPMTRLIRNTTSLAPQGSFLNPTGTGINIEQPIKAGLRALTGNQSIPDWDQWEQYRVDRALADMVGDGTISERDALIAMIERKGGWYDEAQRRAQEQMRFQNFTSVFGGQMFPQGEQEYYKARVLKDQLINQAVAQLGGNPNDLSYGEKMELIRANGLNKKGTPLGDFYDQNPVYNARGDAYAEPEERLKGFLTDEVWQKYLALSALDKRMARQGNKDLAAFITNPERDYKAVTLEKAAEWVKYLRGYLPEAEQTPKVGALNQIQFAPPDLAAAYQTMQDEQKTLFNLDAMQPRMDARAKMTPNEKRAFDAANPDVAAYYKWYGQKMKENPALAKLIHPDTQNNYAANYNQQATNNYLTDQVVKNLNRMVGKLDDSRARRFNPNSRSNKPRPLSRSAVMALAQKKANPNYYLPRDVYRELIAAFKASGLRMAFEQWLQMMAAQGGV